MILDVVFLALVVAILIMIYTIKFGKKQHNQPQAQPIQPHIIPNPQEQPPQQPWQPQQQQQLEQSSEEQEQVMDVRKQIIKQRKKRQKEQRSRAREQLLEHQKQKRQKYQKQQQERDRIDEEKRLKEEEYYQMIAKEEQKKKDQQFNKWKGLFQVDDEGKDKLQPNQEAKLLQHRNNQILSTLRKNKLSLLQDLSHSYKMPTKDIIDLIKQFQKDGKVDGIFDDRGKYLIIQKQQWQAIKSYIKEMGRVKKIDIMSKCAKIIKIPESSQDLMLKKLIEDQVKV